MTGRRSSGLPPALMHEAELDRVIVGDGSGGCRRRLLGQQGGAVSAAGRVLETP